MTLIYKYSRAQAIADGNLIDVSDTAHEVGFRRPTAITRAVWERYVRVPRGMLGQDEAGRLWDVLWMLGCAVMAKDRKGECAADVLHYELCVRNRDGDPEPITLKAVCGPGDYEAPVITVMLPDED